jgi:hypothetical protein
MAVASCARWELIAADASTSDVYYRIVRTETLLVDSAVSLHLGRSDRLMRVTMSSQASFSLLL